MSKAMLKLNFIEITKTLTIQFDLENGWRNLTDPANTSFEKMFLRTLVYHAPINKKTLWTNENSSISKALHKSIL